MRWILALLALVALVAGVAARAYSPSGSYIGKANRCDGGAVNIIVPTACTIGVTCTTPISWAGPPSFQVGGVNFYEQGSTALIVGVDPLEPYGDALQNPPSCTESGDHGMFTGYDCGRMKAHLSGSSGGSNPNYLLETSPDYEFNQYYGVYLYTRIGEGLSAGPAGSVYLTVDQTRLGWIKVEVDYICQWQGFTTRYFEHFVVHATP